MLAANYLGPSEFGITDYKLSIAFLLANLAIFGQDISLGRHLFECESKYKRAQLASQSFAIQLIGSALIFIILALYGDKIASLFPASLGSGESSFWNLIIIIFPTISVIEFVLNELKWSVSRKKYAVLIFSTHFYNCFLYISPCNFLAPSAAQC